MISVWICSAAWRRFDVTRLALSQRQRLCAELAARGIQATMLVAADDENLEIAAEYGCETLEVPNFPLGEKCSRMMHTAAEHADHVVWIGSDDWVHADLFDVLLGDPVENERALIHSGYSVAVVNLDAGLLRVIEMRGRYGCVPWIIDARLLRSKRHELIPHHLKNGLDGALIRGIRLARVPFEVAIAEPHPFRCVDFKTDENLSPYRAVTKHLGVGEETDDPWTALEAWYPADLVGQARTLSASRA